MTTSAPFIAAPRLLRDDEVGLAEPVPRLLSDDDVFGSASRPAENATSRTNWQAMKDLAASGLQGLTLGAKLAAMGIDKAVTGQWMGPGVEALNEFDAAIADQKSPYLRAKEQAMQQRTTAAGDAAAEFVGGGQRTHDGLPAVVNADGSRSTELTITVTDPRLNAGRPTNIPSLWGRKVLDESGAVAAAVKSGRAFPSFKSIDEAVTAAKARSEAGGAGSSDGWLPTAARVAGEFGVGAWESVKDPALLSSQLAQQVPMLGLSKIGARAAGLGVSGAAAVAPRVAATRAGQAVAAGAPVAGAVGAGAALQGADIGTDAYQRLLALPDAQWQAVPGFAELAQQIGPDAAKSRLASDKATMAALQAAGASVLSTALPGGSSVERVLVGKRLSGKTAAAAAGKAFAGEAVQEGVEEGYGQLAANAAVQQVNPAQSLAEGVGAAAGQGAALGGLMGGGATAVSLARPSKDDQPSQEVPAKQPVASRNAGTEASATPGSVAARSKPEQSSAAPAGQLLTDAEVFNGGPTEPAPPEEARLAELELLGSQRALTAGERAEAARLASMFAAAEPSDAEKALTAAPTPLRPERIAATEGAPTTFSTEAGSRLEGRYALVEAGEVQASHDTDLRPNPAFPPELQPRDRTRAASEAQIQNIVGRIDPARLGLSADAGTGAPIIGEDGLVESGNARTIALQRVYGANGQKAHEYRTWLRDNAASFGLTPDQVEGMRQPMLVRVRTTPVDRAEFARQANASTVAAMSPLEQARADAARIDTMDDLRPDEQGDFGTSRDFIRRFVGRLPQTEQAGMIDAGGRLSASGYARVRNAVLAKAYGDSPVLARMVESMDDNLRNVSRALMMAAPRVAQVRSQVEAGRLHAADLTPDLVAAVTELERIKQRGGSVADALAQRGLDGEKHTPAQRELLQFLDENIRRPRRIAEFIGAYADALQAAGDPSQGSLLDDAAAPTVADLVAAAKSATESQPEAAPAGPAPAPASQPNPEASAAPATPESAAVETKPAPAAPNAAAQVEQPAAAAETAAKPAAAAPDTASPTKTAAAKPDGSAAQRDSAVPAAEAAAPASLDEAAHEAATSPNNDLPQPSEAQKEAGNYRKGHVVLNGLGLSIENPAGSTRSGVDRGGKSWSITMRSHYGYVKGSQGADKDHIDVFVKPGTPLDYSGPVFVIDQKHPDSGRFDEHKAMIGFKTGAEARAAYDENYARGWKGFAGITRLPFDEFKAWVLDGRKTKPLKEEMAAAAAAAPKPSAPRETKAAETERPREKLAAAPDLPRSNAPIEDAGEKIGGARKDAWAERGLSAADLDAMSEAEGAQLVTKANVWKPDYAGMVAEGAHPEAAALVKVVFDALAAKPRLNTPEGRRDYVTAMQAVRKVYGAVKTVDEAKGAAAQLHAALGIDAQAGMRSFDDEQKARRRVLFSVYKGRSDPFAIWHDEITRARKLVNGGFPGAVEPWTRRFVVRAIGGSGITDAGVENYLRDAASLGTPMTEEQLRAGAWRVADKAGKVMAYASTQEDAEAAAKQVYEGLKAGGEALREPQRPHLDKLKREGLERTIDRDVVASDFIESFGFRGVEWGNWAAQDERQKIANLAFDALADLARVLNVPRRALSLNGTMGMAFGARGGGRFAAHYEPGKLVINMTKLRGAGSLAHEWAHAFDHYFGELGRPDAYQTLPRGASGWDAEGRYDGKPVKSMVKDAAGKWVPAAGRRLPNVRPELADRIDAVMRALFTGQQSKADMLKEMDGQISRAEQFAADDSQDAAVREVAARQIENFRAARAQIEAAPDGATYPKGRSQFAAEAQKLSGKSSKGYWLRPTEMFARAFEAYVFDRLVAMGARSDYLVHGVEPERYAAGYRGNPYPTGAERAKINAAFDAMVAELKTRDEDGGTVALFSRRPDAGASPDAAALQALAQNDDLFALPKSDKETVQGIVADHNPRLQVREARITPVETMWTITFPDGSFGRITRRAQGIGPRVYGYEFNGGGYDPVLKRPGENPEDVPETTADVWIDVSQLKPGGSGSLIYNVAATLAHNTGAIFIGDPSGVSTDAMRRRPQHMLSSALKFGTTKHLAPHPEQVNGSPKDGVPPLKWVYGDDTGNMERLIALNVEAVDNQLPAAKNLRFDVDTGLFTNTATGVSGGAVSKELLSGLADGAGEGGSGGLAAGGGRTLARASVLRALLRQEGREGAAGGQRNGLLARFAGLADDHPAAVAGTLYSRAAGAAGGGMPLEALRAVAKRVQRGMANLPPVEVLQAPADAPQALRQFIEARGAAADVEGALHDGRIYLFADNLASAERAEFVLAEHEAAHAGLRGLLGRSVDATMRVLYDRNPRLKAQADKLVAQGVPLAEAVEEVIVDIPSAELAQLNGWRRVVQLVRDALSRAGLVKLAGRMDRWLSGSLTEQQRADMMVADLVREARAFVAGRQDDGRVVLGATALSRGQRRVPEGSAPGGGWWAALKSRADALRSPETIDKLIYEGQDKFVDLKRLRDHIRATGGTITDLNDAYLSEELYHKRAAFRSERFLSEELEPLLAELKAADVPLADFERFLHARHAAEANAVLAERNPSTAVLERLRRDARKQLQDLEGRLALARSNQSATQALEDAVAQARTEVNRLAAAQPYQGSEADRLALSGMSDEEARQLVEGLPAERRKVMERLAARVDAINAGTLRMLETYGLMSSDAVEAWRRTYQHYVPLHRDEAHVDTRAHPIGSGFSIKGEAARSRVGSRETVTDILGHIAMQREAAITRGEKNLVSKSLYLMAAQNPDPKWWRLDRLPMVKTLDPGTGFVRTAVDPRFKSLPNVLMLRIAGRDVAITFNEKNPRALRLVEAMKNLDTGDMHVVLSLVARGTRWFAAVNTQYNPVFGIINFARDLQAGLLNLSTTPIAGKEREVAAGVFKAMRAIYRAERHKTALDAEWTRLWREMQAAGGTTGYRDLFTDAKDRTKALTEQLRSLDRGQTSEATHAVVDWLSDYNETMENAVRLAAYRVALQEGLTVPRAASLAKNLTVNFNRKGRQARELGALYAFFNASVQGTARMAETLRGPLGKKIMLGGVMLGAATTLLGMAVMGGGDDDPWEKIPEFVKERSIIIPLGREDYVALPMPLGFHVFPNVGRVAVEMAFASRGKTKAAHIGSLLQSILDAFNPIGGSQNLAQMAAPTVIDPFVALMENRDWTGRPIYRDNSNPLDPQPGHAMTKDSASTPSRLLARAINDVTGGTEFRPGAWSPTPDQLDYLIGQLTGGLGRELLKVNQAIAAPLTGDELPAHKVPLLGRIYGNTRGLSGQSGTFYDNIRQINEIENEIQGLQRTDRDVEELYRSEPLADLVGEADAAERRVRQLRRQRRDAVEQGDPDWREQVREIDAEIVEAMSALNAQVTAARAGRAAAER